MTYPVKSLLFFPFTTGEQTGETFYSDIFIHVKSKYYVKNTSPHRNWTGDCIFPSDRQCPGAVASRYWTGLQAMPPFRRIPAWSLPYLIWFFRHSGIWRTGRKILHDRWNGILHRDFRSRPWIGIPFPAFHHSGLLRPLSRFRTRYCGNRSHGESR